MKVPAKSEKHVYVSRTIVVNVLAFVIAILPFLFKLPQIQPYVAYAPIILPILNILLRFVGDNPVAVPDPTITVDRTPEHLP